MDGMSWIKRWRWQTNPTVGRVEACQSVTERFSIRVGEVRQSESGRSVRCRVQVARRWWMFGDFLGLGSSWTLQEGSVIVESAVAPQAARATGLLRGRADPSGAVMWGIKAGVQLPTFAEP